VNVGPASRSRFSFFVGTKGKSRKKRVPCSSRLSVRRRRTAEEARRRSDNEACASIPSRLQLIVMVAVPLIERERGKPRGSGPQRLQFDSGRQNGASILSGVTPQTSIRALRALMAEPSLRSIAVTRNPASRWLSGNGRALAQGRLSLPLALEVAPTGRATADPHGAARVDPADERRKSALGRAAHPRLSCSSSGLRSHCRASARNHHDEN
jgi:hypothetical protein